MQEERQDIRQHKLGLPAEAAIGLVERRGPCAQGAFARVLPAGGGAERNRFAQLPKLGADRLRIA